VSDAKGLKAEMVCIKLRYWKTVKGEWRGDPTDRTQHAIKPAWDEVEKALEDYEKEPH